MDSPVSRAGVWGASHKKVDRSPYHELLFLINPYQSYGPRAVVKNSHSHGYKKKDRWDPAISKSTTDR